MTTVHRVRRLGEVPTFAAASSGGQSYQEWYAAVKRLGGAPVTLPDNVPDMMRQYSGRPAARYDAATYANLFNAGQIDANTPQVMSNTNAYAYVVAPPSAWQGAPQLMTRLQQIENAVFTGGDIAADAIGLPSLNSIENFLKGAGRDILVGIAVTAGVSLLVKKFMKRR